MKKIIVFIFLISFFLVLPLPAQGKTIVPFVPDADKLNITGQLQFIDLRPDGRLILDVNLSFQGRPVAGADVWLNEQIASDREIGRYVAGIDPYMGRIGNRLEISVRFPREVIPGLPKPPFEGRQVLATYVIDNLVEWVFPTYTIGQTIDLAMYPAGGIPFRWDFKGAIIPIKLLAWDVVANTNVLNRTVNTEEILVPKSIFVPGRKYSTGLMDKSGAFKLTKLAAAGSKIIINYSSYPAHFTITNSR